MRSVGLLLLGVAVGFGLVIGGLWALPTLYPSAYSSSGSASAEVTLLPPPPVTAVPAAPVAPPPARQIVEPPVAPIAAPPPPVAPPVRALPTATAVATSPGAARLLAEEQAIVDIYDRVSPAVVNITNRRGVPGSGDFPRTGAGSGVIFDARGLVLTNNHVVDDATRLEVTLADGTNFQAKLLGRDPANDLAVVQIEAPRADLTVATFGDSEALKPGQLAIAIGSPFGLDRTVTLGVISSTGRTRSNEGRRPIRGMIQTDAPINPGNSGGPLLNSRGEVVGINTAIESPVRGSVGVGFAVPINTAKLFMPDMLAGKRVTHPWLGISGVAMTPATAQELGVSESQGVYVSEVVQNGPSAKAGLRGASGGSQGGALPKGGDIIVAIDNERLTKTESISAYLDTKRVGETVKLHVVRDGQRRVLDVPLEEWPETAASQTPQPGRPGFEAPELPPGFPRIPGLPFPGR